MKVTQNLKRIKIPNTNNMDYKKSKAATNTETRNVMDFARPTGNIYESVAIMSKRANQISTQMKEDLNRKLKEFATSSDNLEETFRLPQRDARPWAMQWTLRR